MKSEHTPPNPLCREASILFKCPKFKPPKGRNINRRREAKGGEWAGRFVRGQNVKSTATLAKTTQDKNTKMRKEMGIPALVLGDDLS